MPSHAKLSQPNPSQAKPSQAKPNQAKPSQAKPSQCLLCVCVSALCVCVSAVREELKQTPASLNSGPTLPPLHPSTPLLCFVYCTVGVSLTVSHSQCLTHSVCSLCVSLCLVWLCPTVFAVSAVSVNLGILCTVLLVSYSQFRTHIVCCLCVRLCPTVFAVSAMLGFFPPPPHPLHPHRYRPPSSLHSCLCSSLILIVSAVLNGLFAKHSSTICLYVFCPYVSLLRVSSALTKQSVPVTVSCSVFYIVNELLASRIFLIDTICITKYVYISI
jgi:hypothetical protein